MTQFIRISDIEIPPNRQRREFKLAELNELAEGIQRNGLLHAIVLREGKILVAGERRLRAITDIYELGGAFSYNGAPVLPDHIPFTDLGELSEAEAREAELEENIRRVDLTWQEKAKATAGLMELRSLQAERSGDIPPTVAEIAVEVRGSSEGEYQTATRNEIITARYLDDEDVAKAPTLKEAFKVIKNKERAKKSAELAQSVGLTFTANEHLLTNTNSLEWMAGCPPSWVDVILTDPPYGMGADEFGDSGGKAEGAHGYVDSRDNALDCYNALATEGFRLTKPDAHLYAFCDIDLFPELKRIFSAAGWKVFRTPLLWYKPTAFRAPWPEQGPQRKYETILFAVKGSRRVNYLAGDVLEYPPDTNLGHAAQKPVALYRDLLKRSAQPGDRVFDPFCGTGPIIEAGHELQCRVTAIELDPVSYGIAAKRLQGLKAQEPGLF